MSGRVARRGHMRYAHKVIIGNSERKKQLGRPVQEWEDDIKM
jgi:hypothetical protein